MSTAPGIRTRFDTAPEWAAARGVVVLHDRIAIANALETRLAPA